MISELRLQLREMCFELKYIHNLGVKFVGDGKYEFFALIVHDFRADRWHMFLAHQVRDEMQFENLNFKLSSEFCPCRVFSVIEYLSQLVEITPDTVQAAVSFSKAVNLPVEMLLIAEEMERDGKLKGNCQAHFT